MKNNAFWFFHVGSRRLHTRVCSCLTFFGYNIVVYIYLHQPVLILRHCHTLIGIFNNKQITSYYCISFCLLNYFQNSNIGVRACLRYTLVLVISNSIACGDWKAYYSSYQLQDYGTHPAHFFTRWLYVTQILQMDLV